MFMAAFLTIAKIQNQTKCPSTDEQNCGIYEQQTIAQS